MDHRLMFATALIAGFLILEGGASTNSTTSDIITAFNGQPLSTSITNATCGQKKLCLSTPTSCDPAGSAPCLFGSTSMSSQGNLVFELSGNSSGYIAVGLNTENSTQNSTMFVCAQQNGSISVYAFLLSNNVLPQNNYYPVVSAQGSVSGNVIQCTFQVSGLSSMILNPTTQINSLYIFLATGNITNGIPELPTVQLVNTNFLGLMSMTNFITFFNNLLYVPIATQPLTIDITRRTCDRNKLCMAIPTSCDPAGSAPCLFASSSITLQGNLAFELSGNSSGYIALGLNTENSTQNSTMFACGQQNGVISVYTFLIEDNAVYQQSTFPVVSAQGSVSGNVLKCTFQVPGLNTISVRSRAQMSGLYVFLATGNITNGMPQYPTINWNTNYASLINIQNFFTSNNLIYAPIATQPLTTSITNATCGQKKLCLSTPTSCDPAGSAPCLFGSSSMSSQGNLVFELSGNSSGYIALGLSTENLMQNSTMFVCAQQNGNISVYAFLLSNNVLSQNNYFPVVSAQGSVSGNVIQCTFQVPGLSSIILNSVTQTNSLYISLATGNITNGIPELPTVQLVNTNFLGLMSMTNLITFFNNLLYVPIATQPLTTSITRRSCGTNKLCVATPVSCNPAGSTPCLFASISKPSLSQDPNVTIELRGDSSGYVAVGGNFVNSKESSIVFACAQENGNISIYTFLLSNNVLSQYNYLSVVSAQGSVSGNVIQCTFQVSGLSSMILNPTTQINSLYIFFATGNITNGILQAPVIQLSSTLLNSDSVIPIPVQPLKTDITSTACGKTKMCLGTPNGCNPAGSSNCLFASSAALPQGIIAFELRGESNGYIALGLSTANTTQNANMFACGQLNGTVFMFNTKLINNSVSQDSTISMDNGLGAQNNYVTQCTFNSAGLSSTASQSRALDTTFFAFLATGNVINGTLQTPVIKLQPLLVDLANVSSNLYQPNSSPPVLSYSALLILLSVVPFQLF